MALCNRVKLCLKTNLPDWKLVSHTDLMSLFFSPLTTPSSDVIVYWHTFKEKFGFLHKDIYDHIWCSTALLWQLAKSWELELVANITASWKQQRSIKKYN